MEITYLGSGICSHSLLTAGAILSVTVPETTKKSACRGLAGSGITPSRMTSYRGDANAAPFRLRNMLAPIDRPTLNSGGSYLVIL